MAIIHFGCIVHYWNFFYLAISKLLVFYFFVFLNITLMRRLQHKPHVQLARKMNSESTPVSTGIKIKKASYSSLNFSRPDRDKVSFSQSFSKTKKDTIIFGIVRTIRQQKEIKEQKRAIHAVINFHLSLCYIFVATFPKNLFGEGLLSLLLGGINQEDEKEEKLSAAHTHTHTYIHTHAKQCKKKGNTSNTIKRREEGRRGGHDICGCIQNETKLKNKTNEGEVEESRFRDLCDKFKHRFSEEKIKEVWHKCNKRDDRAEEMLKLSDPEHPKFHSLHTTHSVC
ncbi:hypothetical protein RFI_02456, partial [Reticulomyxa filosa]